MNIERIVSEIKKGNVVITPTDTVYGILADAMNEEAINKVYDAKKRVSRKPLLLLVSDINMLYEYTSDLSPLEKEIIERYCPGRLTLILKKNNKISDSITEGSIYGREYVGMRIPDHQELVSIIKRIGNPIISTSANIESKETITSVDKIEKEMLDKISYVEDGGEITALPSTIIKVTDNKIEFLREGDLANTIKKDYNIGE